MASTLTQMLSGEIPCEKLFEDGRFAAVLEPAPLAPGHAFVFPKREAASWLDLDTAELAGLSAAAQRLAQAIQKAVECRRVALVAYGVKTPHVHFHLIPVSGTAGEIDLTRVRPPASPEDLRQTASAIRAALLNS